MYLMYYIMYINVYKGWESKFVTLTENRIFSITLSQISKRNVLKSVTIQKSKTQNCTVPVPYIKSTVEY